jgi:hypothetical protein
VIRLQNLAVALELDVHHDYESCAAYMKLIQPWNRTRSSIARDAANARLKTRQADQFETVVLILSLHLQYISLGFPALCVTRKGA